MIPHIQIAAQIDHFESVLSQKLPSSGFAVDSVPRVEPVVGVDFAGVEVGILRLDALHPVVSGNKWFKLKYNLASALEQGCHELLSFGGAWSNHLHALAWACAQSGLSCTGVVRGDEHDVVDNPMLREAAAWGMVFEFVSRQQYRELREDYSVLATPGRWIIPEGGDNWPGMLGMTALALNQALSWHQYSHVILAVGTGCTFAGMRLGLPATTHLLGVSALKGAWVRTAMEDRLHKLNLADHNWTLDTEWHRGGFARVDDTLLSFIADFEDNTGLMLDPVYTAKAMMALQAFSVNGTIPRGSRVLFIHSGGLQGRRGFNLGE